MDVIPSRHPSISPRAIGAHDPTAACLARAWVHAGGTIQERVEANALRDNLMLMQKSVCDWHSVSALHALANWIVSMADDFCKRMQKIG